LDKAKYSNRSEINYFSSVYKGNPPWDIGYAQPVFKRLAKTLPSQSKVLDVGCGTGENILFFAKMGFESTGIDFTSEAIDKAITKAKERNLNAKFYVMDALELGRLNQKFNFIIDSGLFHTFSDSERPLFKYSLSKVIFTKGIYYMLCFSDREHSRFGPRRISREEIYDTFNRDWKVISIEPENFESNFGHAKAWLAKIQYIG
jgi:ubiquinone/menaquinone biosynthesis C-methylase UbiE